MRTIVLQDLPDLEQKFLQAVHIMMKEKKYEDRWNDHHDTEDKVQCQKWSEERNNFLAGLTVHGETKREYQQDLKVEISEKVQS